MQNIDYLSGIGKYNPEAVKEYAQEILSSPRVRPIKEETILLCRLNNIPVKVIKQKFKIHFQTLYKLFDKQEKDLLAIVYEAITGKVMSMNCNACVPVAVKIVSNFIKYHEIKVVEKIEAKIIQAHEVLDYALTSIRELKRIAKEKEIALPHNASKQTIIDLLNGK